MYVYTPVESLPGTPIHSLQSRKPGPPILRSLHVRRTTQAKAPMESCTVCGIGQRGSRNPAQCKVCRLMDPDTFPRDPSIQEYLHWAQDYVNIIYTGLVGSLGTFIAENTVNESRIPNIIL